MQTLFASILMTALTLGTSMFTARTLGAQGRGELAMLLLWPQLLASFATLGLPAAFVYHAKKYPEHAPGMLGWNLVFALLSSIAITAAGWWLASQAVAGADWLRLGNVLSGQPAELMGFISGYYLWVAVPVVALALFTSTVAQGFDDYRAFNVSRVLWPAGHLVAMMAVWASGLFDAKIAALCSVGAGALAVAWTVGHLWRHYRPRFSDWSAHMAGQLRYGLRAYGMEILGVFSNQMDKVFILGVLSLRDLGIYSVSFGLSRLLGLLQNSVASVIFPATASQPVPQVVAAVARAARIALVLSLAAGLPLILLGSHVLGWVFGHEFAEGATVLQLLVLEVVISGTAWVLAQAFNAVGRPGLVVLRQTAGLVVLLAALSLLAPRYGAAGVAFAMLLGGIVRLLLTLVTFPKALGHPVPSLVFTRDDWEFACRQLVQCPAKS